MNACHDFIKKKMSLILRLAVGFGILFLLSRTKLISYKEMISLFAAANMYYLLAAFLLYLACNFIAIFRWRYILNTLGVKTDLGLVSYLFYVGLYFNLAVPSFVAQDVFRGTALASRSRSETGKVASSVLMDRFSGMTAIALTSLGAFLFSGGMFKSKPAVLIALLVLWGITATGALIIFSRRLFSWITLLLGKRPLRQKLIDFHDHLIFFRDKPLIFLKVTLASLLIQAISALFFYVCAIALGVEKNVGVFFLLVPIVTSIASIPLTPSGIGTRDAAAVLFFPMVGIAHNVAVGLAQLNFIAILINGLFGGILYVTLHHRWFQPVPQSARA
jgi:glycosyltransferase 2 family protein